MIAPVMFGRSKRSLATVLRKLKFETVDVDRFGEQLKFENARQRAF